MVPSTTTTTRRCRRRRRREEAVGNAPFIVLLLLSVIVAPLMSACDFQVINKNKVLLHFERLVDDALEWPGLAITN